jgi:hypothetical protein
MWNGDINNLEEVREHLNRELSKGRKQKEIEINDFKVNERVIAKRLISKGYKKIENQYIKYDNINTVVIKEKTEEYDKGNTVVINKNEIQDKIIGLAKNYDKILKIIEEYDKQYDKEYDGIIIELPIETIKDFRTSIRVNNVIWEQFNEFANNYKEFTKRDLLSMALKEYMDKYK